MRLERFKNSLYIFPLVYFALAFLSFCSVTAERSQLTLLSVLILTLGALRFITTLGITWKGRKLPLIWVCLGLIISYGLSMIFNASYGFLGNLKGLCWMCLCLLVVLPSAAVEKAKGREDKKDPLIFGLLILTGLAALASLILMVSNVHIELVPGMHIGTYSNRLYGVYTDPNYGGVLSSAAAMVSLMLLLTGRVRKLPLKILLAVHILLQYLYVVFGYSRTAQVVIIVGLGMGFLYYVIFKRPRVYKALAAGLVILALCVSFQQVRDGYNYIVTLQNENMAEEPAEPGEPEEKPIETIERTSDVQSDISNIRIPIWQDGLAAFAENPVFGISYRNILPWFEANHPEAFIVNYTHGLNTFHNVFVDVLASQGLLGILLFALAIVIVFIMTIRLLKKISPEKLDRAALYALPALVIMGGSLMISDILYVNTPTAVLFWYCLGQWLSNDPRVSTLREN